MRTFNDIVKQLIKEIIGDKGVSLYNLIWSKKNVSEFKIAEELKLTINQVRNLLYQFSTYNLVYSTRKKDRDKGWYIYYWTINFNEVRSLLLQRKKSGLAHLYTELETEKQHKYYVCSRDGTKLELEEAMEHNFKCPECEQVLKHIDSDKRIEAIKQEIDQIKQDLGNLSNNAFIEEIISQQVEEEPPRERKKRKKKKLKKKKAKKSKGKIKAKKTKKPKIKPKEAKKSKKNISGKAGKKSKR